MNLGERQRLGITGTGEDLVRLQEEIESLRAEVEWRAVRLIKCGEMIDALRTENSVLTQTIASLREENARWNSWRDGTLRERSIALDLADKRLEELDEAREIIQEWVNLLDSPFTRQLNNQEPHPWAGKARAFLEKTK